MERGDFISIAFWVRLWTIVRGAELQRMQIWKLFERDNKLRFKDIQVIREIFERRVLIVAKHELEPIFFFLGLFILDVYGDLHLAYARRDDRSAERQERVCQ